MRPCPTPDPKSFQTSYTSLFFIFFLLTTMCKEKQTFLYFSKIHILPACKMCICNLFSNTFLLDQTSLI